MSIPGSASPLFFGAGAEAAAFQIDRSLRFDDASNAHLRRTPSTAGNRKTWTLSFWIKRTEIGGTQYIFNAGKTSNGDHSVMRINNDQFQMYQYGHGGDTTAWSGGNGSQLRLEAKFRDPSAWMHIVVAMDTTQATQSNRLRYYVNGVEQTDFSSTSYPVQNSNPGYWNAADMQCIGGIVQNTSPSGQSDYYLAEVHMVDGTQLAASDFGEYDDNNVWQPKDCKNDLTYGTTGFYLKFDDNSTAAALGNDSSGNDNDWTVNNLTAENPTTLPGVAFDGTDDFLKISGSSDFDFGTGDFTVECFVYFNNLSNNQGVLDTRSSSNTNGFALLGRSNGTVSMADGTSLIGDAISVSHSQWMHLAASRSGSSLKFFVDGVLSSTVTNSTDFSNDDFIIGTVGGETEDLNGFVSNVRVIKGTALYTSSFTLPTTPLSNVTNTVLLCCQSSSSATAATVSPGTITANGDAFAGEFSDSTSANDSLIDTPTNYTATSGNNGGNYAVLNPLAKGAAHTLSNGNLDFTMPIAGGSKTTPATMGVSSGKWYWEMNVTTVVSYYPGIGIDSNPDPTGQSGDTATGRMYLQNGQKFSNATLTNYGANYAAGDVIAAALDMDGGTITFYKNGVSQGQAFSGITGTQFPVLVGHNGAAGSFNFGQRPFAYTPPTNHLALVTSNLSDPTIADGSTVFNAVTYTGTGSSQSITTSFSPDLVWIKSRSIATGHSLFDTIRGALKRLQSSSTGAEATANGTLTSFDTDGFTLGAGTLTNQSSASQVAWAWDAGSSTVSNTDGSITSSVRVNQSAGFSIVSYTGNSTAGSTIGHGLNAQPGLVIIKNRDRSINWVVGHLEGDSFKTGRIYLNTTGAQGTDEDFFNDTNPTSSVFTVKNNYEVNYASEDYIAYCFAPVEGYSAFGSYTGNGSTDGPFIFTGFRPAFILLKRTDSAFNWILSDTARDPYNEAENLLRPNLSDAEVSQYLDQDILSNGFKHRGTDGASNASGGTYIYAAFAEHPFKTSRAR